MSSNFKLPAAEVLPVVEKIREAMRPACEKTAIAGSIRRREELVGDIEICVLPKYDAEVMGDLI